MNTTAAAHADGRTGLAAGACRPGASAAHRTAARRRAYICGEESAMLESIEGKRACHACARPMWPSAASLVGPRWCTTWRRCTGCVRSSSRAPAAFTAHGRHGRQGLRRFSVSGRVREPGVKLAPAGITLRELVDEFCGGMQQGHTLYAYLPGGASGGILPASLADVPLDFDTLQPHGCFIGSAAVIVLSQADRGGGRGAQRDGLLRRRVLRPVHTLPRRHGQGRGADGRAAVEPAAAGRTGPGDARRLDLRPGPGRTECGGLRDALLCARGAA
jgi:hypothetical protein